MSAESIIRDLRRDNERLIIRNHMLEKQLNAEKELNEKQWKRLNEAETYIQRSLGGDKWEDAEDEG